MTVNEDYYRMTQQKLVTHDERIGKLIDELQESCLPSDQAYAVERAGLYFLRQHFGSDATGSLDALARLLIEEHALDSLNLTVDKFLD